MVETFTVIIVDFTCSIVREMAPIWPPDSPTQKKPRGKRAAAGTVLFKEGFPYKGERWTITLPTDKGMTTVRELEIIHEGYGPPPYIYPGVRYNWVAKDAETEKFN